MASPKEELGEMKEEDEEEEDEDMEESSGEEEEESLQKAKQAITCRSVTLNTLMEDGIIEPGQGVLSIDYLGQRFEADLLESGKIKWQGSQEEFGTPSAWALHCKRLVNPIKRSGCGWASVKYKNRKLDIWKSMWARKHRPTNPFKSPHQSSGSISTTTTTTTSMTSPSTTTTAVPTTTVTATSSSGSASTTTSMDTTTTSAMTVTAVQSSTTATKSSSSSASPLKHDIPMEVSLATPAVVKEAEETETQSKQVEKKTDPGPSLGPSSTLLSSTSSSTATAVTVTTKESVKSHIKPKTSRTTSHDEAPLNLSTVTPLVGRIDRSPGRHSPRKGNLGYSDTWLPAERKSVSYSSLGTRGVDVDPHTLVKCEHFDTHSKIQPFTVSVTSNTLLLMDFHCHLTKSEVVGYLGGRWDSHKQHLSVEQVFPACCRLGDKDRAPLVEEEIRRNMRQKNQMVVGWYHSHPYCQPDPSVRDVDCQMSYQLKMRGSGSMYLPCLGFIVSPFEKLPPKPDSKIQAFWVMPNLEHPSSYNIPMHVSYSIVRDSSLTEDLLSDMKRLTEFYRGAVDKVHLKDHWGEAITYMDKIKASLRSKLPEDQLDSSTFLDYVQQLLRDMR